MNFFETQKLISELTPEFSETVCDKSILIVGLGGNGTHIALAALRMGFREIVGIDCDVVSPGNLSRQVLYSKKAIGRLKTNAALEFLNDNNLNSNIQVHDLNILQKRREFGALVSKSDMVFVVVDQPFTTFFAVDTCFFFKKPAIVGGTSVLSGTSTRVSWMDGISSPCLNCSTRINSRLAEWARYYKFDSAERASKPEAVQIVDDLIKLDGGHPSFYPTACIGSNLMLCVALNLFMGRKDIPRIIEYSVLDFRLETRPIKSNPECFTCATKCPDFPRSQTRQPR